MLKIKESVDLKELEKFGFTYNKDFDCWEYKRNFDNFNGLRTFCMVHIYQEREIYCSMYIGCNEPHDTTREINIYDVLFNLIQAGLVEKVEEESNG